MNLYAELGVERSASAAEVKRAYRSLTQQFHPDRNPGDQQAEERFKGAAAAYEVLGDDQRRRLYDEFGEMSLAVGFDAGHARARRQAAAAVSLDLRGSIDLPFAVAVRGGRLSVQLPFGVHGHRQVVLDVPAGADAGLRWRFPGRGAGVPAGALIVEVRSVLEDARWSVEGLDLHTVKEVALADVYEGAEVIVEAPTGPLSVRLPRGELRSLRVSGAGLRRGFHIGDLVVALQVRMPPLDARLRAELRRLA